MAGARFATDADVNRERMVFVLAHLVGRRVTVKLRDRISYEGTFHGCAADGDFSIALRDAYQLDHNGEKKSPDQPVATLLIQAKDFLQVTAKNVPTPGNVGSAAPQAPATEQAPLPLQPNGTWETPPPAGHEAWRTHAIAKRGAAAHPPEDHHPVPDIRRERDLNALETLGADPYRNKRGVIFEMKRINALNLEPSMPPTGDDMVGRGGRGAKDLQSRQNRGSAPGGKMAPLDVKQELHESMEDIKRKMAAKALASPPSQAKAFNLNAEAGEFIPSSAQRGGQPDGWHSSRQPWPQQQFTLPRGDLAMLRRSLIEVLEPYFREALRTTMQGNQEGPRWPEARGPSFRGILGSPSSANRGSNAPVETFLGCGQTSGCGAMTAPAPPAGAASQSASCGAGSSGAWGPPVATQPMAPGQNTVGGHGQDQLMGVVASNQAAAQQPMVPQAFLMPGPPHGGVMAAGQMYQPAQPPGQQGPQQGPPGQPMVFNPQAMMGHHGQQVVIPAGMVPQAGLQLGKFMSGQGGGQMVMMPVVPVMGQPFMQGQGFVQGLQGQPGQSGPPGQHGEMSQGAHMYHPGRGGGTG